MITQKACSCVVMTYSQTDTFSLFSGLSRSKIYSFILSSPKRFFFLQMEQCLPLLSGSPALLVHQWLHAVVHDSLCMCVCSATCVWPSSHFSIFLAIFLATSRAGNRHSILGEVIYIEISPNERYFTCVHSTPLRGVGVTASSGPTCLFVAVSTMLGHVAVVDND